MGARFWVLAAIAFLLAVGATVGIVFMRAQTAAEPEHWRAEWPRTDFARHAIDYADVIAGGPRRDAIRPIDRPRFVGAFEAADIPPEEPVVALEIDGDSRAYPLRILIWHEVVNDVVAGMPVAVTYSPLCDSAVVYGRGLEGRTLEFGTTGKLRHSNTLLYDRQTESWWQQFTGQAVVGALTGQRLAPLPARLESLGDFQRRAPRGRVMVPTEPGSRPYGETPYVGYENAGKPFLYQGEPPAGVDLMARVVAVGDRAWTLELVRIRGMIEAGDLTIRWRPGRASALGQRRIAAGEDIGSVTVQRRDGDRLRDVAHVNPFAFAFRAFTPNGAIHGVDGTVRW